MSLTKCIEVAQKLRCFAAGSTALYLGDSTKGLASTQSSTLKSPL